MASRRMPEGVDTLGTENTNHKEQGGPRVNGAPSLSYAFAFMAREGRRATERRGHLVGPGLGLEFRVLLNSRRVCPF